MNEIFNQTDLYINLGLFATSTAYAIILTLWLKKWPESFKDLTWFEVIIGVGYTILFLGLIIPLHYWLKICAAFFFAGIPIVLRSIIITANERRETNLSLESMLQLLLAKHEQEKIEKTQQG